MFTSDLILDTISNASHNFVSKAITNKPLAESAAALITANTAAARQVSDAWSTIGTTIKTEATKSVKDMDKFGIWPIFEEFASKCKARTL